MFYIFIDIRFNIMSKRKKTITTKDKATDHQLAIDKQICQLADELQEQGLTDYDLIVAVARIYSNSVLIAYVDKQNLNK